MSFSSDQLEAWSEKTECVMDGQSNDRKTERERDEVMCAR